MLVIIIIANMLCLSFMCCLCVVQLGRGTYFADKFSLSAQSKFAIDWVRVGDRAFVAALYNPPLPTYHPENLLEHIEACVAEITHDYPLADIVLAGDLNQLSDRDVVERTGLTQTVRQPTRGANILDRIFVSSPDLYSMKCIHRHHLFQEI